MELVSKNFFESARSISEKTDNLKDLAVILGNLNNFEMRIFLAELGIKELVSELANSDVSELTVLNGHFIGEENSTSKESKKLKHYKVSDKEVSALALRLADSVVLEDKSYQDISRKILASYLLNFPVLLKLSIIADMASLDEDEVIE